MRDWRSGLDRYLTSGPPDPDEACPTHCEKCNEEPCAGITLVWVDDLPGPYGMWLCDICRAPDTSDDEPDHEDDGEALASAGFGTTEDYE